MIFVVEIHADASITTRSQADSLALNIEALNVAVWLIG